MTTFDNAVTVGGMNFPRPLIPVALAFAALTMTACQGGNSLETHGNAPSVDIGTPDSVDATFRTAFEIALYTDHATYCDAFWQLDDDDVIVAVEEGFGRPFTHSEAAIVLDIFYTEC